MNERICDSFDRPPLLPPVRDRERKRKQMEPPGPSSEYETRSRDYQNSEVYFFYYTFGWEDGALAIYIRKDQRQA
jgi:hypothetical protein